MIKWKTYTETCPYCNGSDKTTLDGTFKEHKCACKNGKVERTVGFDIPEDMKNKKTYRMFKDPLTGIVKYFELMFKDKVWKSHEIVFKDNSWKTNEVLLFEKSKKQ